MQLFLEHVLGIMCPIDPRRWTLLARRLRHAEGWMPPMMLIAAAMVLGFIGQGLGLLGAHVAIKIFNYIAIVRWSPHSGVPAPTLA